MHADDGFSEGSAAVICRQLGYPGGGLAYSSATFGDATRPFILDELNCTGECSHKDWWRRVNSPAGAAGAPRLVHTSCTCWTSLVHPAIKPCVYVPALCTHGLE